MKNPELDALILEYKVQPVGNGYIDCIILQEEVSSFLQKITEIGIYVTHIAWWCHCTKEHETKYHCPHGMGGPRSKYYEGWFSEMPDYCFIEMNGDNQDTENYIFYDVKNEPFYSECLVPGLWLSAHKMVTME